MATKETEADFQRAVLDLAEACGWAFRYHTFDSRRSTSGFPDLVLMRPPKLLVVELKTKTGKTSLAQYEWLEAFQACGVTALIWRPQDWKTITATLRRPNGS